MANNRIYIRCKNCGEALFLGKKFGEAYYYVNYHGSTLEKDLNDFYEKHDWCNVQRERSCNVIDTEPKLCENPEDIHNENMFEIAYEFDRRERAENDK